jgi:putative peptidoglycan lipid II flippase
MLRSTGIVMLFGIAAQVAAFLRTAIIAALLGVSPDVDAYYLGLIAPIFASTVTASWLQVSFVGHYTTLVTHESRELAAAYRGRILLLVLVGALFLTGLCLLLPRQIMGLFMTAHPEMVASAAAALRPASLILLPLVVGDFLSLVLNSHRRFFAAAAAPLANALVSIAGLLLWPNPDLAALVWTLLAGSVAQCLVVVAALAILRLRFQVWTNAAAAEIRGTLLLALPMFLSAMLVNAAAPILQFGAAHLGDGAVAIYGYATRVNGSISQILIMGLSTVLLPHFAALWSRGDKDEILLLFRRLARWSVLAVAYLTAGIFLMGETATQVLFQRGAFDVAQTAQVSAVWFILSLSLFPYVFGTFIAKFCQATGDARSLLASSITLFASTWVAGWYGATIGTVGGIAAAYTASFVVMGFYWFTWLSWRIRSGPVLRDLAISLFRCALILAPASVAGHWFQPFGDSAVVDLICRGAIYTATALLLFTATKSYSWFLAKNSG